MDRPDFLGLSSQAPHRVVSFPASQSLHASTASASTAISTGIPRLDEALCPSSPDDLSCLAGTETKGIPGGHVTEVFGPPGVGKTTLALGVASNALRAGGKVVWIDTGSPLPRSRLRDFLASTTPSSPNQTQSPSNPAPDLSQNLLYIQARTLPHLLSLLHHPPPSFPPPNTTLLVIDTISSPFQPYYPAPSDLKSRLSSTRTDKSQLSWLLNRKWNVTSDLATQLSKLAASNRIAVLALNQMHTRIKGLPRATLTPVLAGGGWEAGVFARVGLYRDFVRRGPDGMGVDAGGEVEGEGRLRRVRFAEVMKRNGRAVLVRREEDTVVPFLIEMDGLHALHELGSSHPVPMATAQKTNETEKLALEVEPTRASELEQSEEQDLSQECESTKPSQLEPEQELKPELEPEPKSQRDIQQIPQPKTELQQEQAQPPEQETEPDTLDPTARKRKVDEIADSQDEDDSDGEFGWNEDDDAGLLERD